jgi:hypothetical protein
VEGRSQLPYTHEYCCEIFLRTFTTIKMTSGTIIVCFWTPKFFKDNLYICYYFSDEESKAGEDK